MDLTVINHPYIYLFSKDLDQPGHCCGGLSVSKTFPCDVGVSICLSVHPPVFITVCYKKILISCHTLCHCDRLYKKSTTYLVFEVSPISCLSEAPDLGNSIIAWTLHYKFKPLTPTTLAINLLSCKDITYRTYPAIRRVFFPSRMISNN